ncbi:16S rRNA (uracil(1498)-N(3))-methyltransferase [Buchnera aphidicola]|uniref:16S rRNA (uracil(1498)-N(3))-methyltransferase n=1 Tax=Buchnera aphidicola TaxID=9 RepID=UPI003463D5B5
MFYEKEIKRKQNIHLTNNNLHYFKNVLRVKINEKIEVFNNTNHVFLGKITLIKKNLIQILIEKKLKKNKESSLKIHFAPIMLNQKKMNFIIQKSTELGVHSITPLLQKNKFSTEINSSSLLSQYNRWKNIAISACQQCERNKIPIINYPEYMYSWCSKLPNNELKIIFDPYTKKTINSLTPIQKKINVIIGGESGFSIMEINNFKKKYNFKNISLGKRILRAETSSIAAISILLYKYGELDLTI